MVRLRIGKAVIAIAAALVLAAPAGVTPAAAQAKPLYQQMVERYPAPKLADVDGREYKVLFDPAQTKATPEGVQGPLEQDQGRGGEARPHRHREGQESAGHRVLDQGVLRHPGPGAVEQGLPDPDHARATRTASRATGRGHREGRLRRRQERSLARFRSPSSGVDKFKTEAEENVGFGPGATCAGYVEKGSTFSIPAGGARQVHAGRLRQVHAGAAQAGPARRHRARVDQGLLVPGPPGRRRAARHGPCGSLDGGVEPDRGRRAVSLRLLVRLRRLDFYAVAADACCWRAVHDAGAARGTGQRSAAPTAASGAAPRFAR